MGLVNNLVNSLLSGYSMKFNFTGLSDPGMVRRSNQDSFFLDPEGNFFLVADGMGGHAGGEEASRLATEVIQKHLREHWRTWADSEVLLTEAIQKANEAIIQDQENYPERGDMGTTLVVVMFHNGKYWLTHIGDSRIYRLRGDNLEQLTEDDTWVARALKGGELTIEEARVHPWRHILSKCLGRKDLASVVVQLIDLQSGDRLLLCSDGLTEELDDETIIDYLKPPVSCPESAESLVKAAKEHGGRDNITVVIIEAEG